MDALEKARELVRDAYYDERGMADVMRRDAAIWAAIAQTEAMQLVGKRLEQWMSVQGLGFEVIEAAERGIRYQKENERLEAEVKLLKAWQKDSIAAHLMARGEAACDG